MAESTNKSGNKPKKGQPIPSQNTNKNIIPVKRDLLDACDQFLSKRIKTIFYISLGLIILFSFLLFDVKVGPGGDDSAYLLRAYDFIHGFRYPGYQGPLYPIILSLVILVFGIQIPLLKLLSLIFMVTAFVFFFKTFVNRIPAIILTSTLLLVSISYFVLYFSSQTYNEAFFMMVQFIFFWFFTTRFIDEQPSGDTGYKKYILLGFMLFILSITKNIAVFSFLVIALWFLVYKRWKDAGLSMLSFLGFFGLFEIIKRLLWKGQGFQLSSQGSGLMYKDFYNPGLGKEDIMGFVQRFIDNSNLYLSKHLFKFFGLVSETATDVNPFLTIFIYLLIIFGILFVFRKNKLLFLTGIYSYLAIISLIFISSQKNWDQWRMIIIFYPFLLLILFSALYHLFKRSSVKGWQFIVPLYYYITFLY